MLRSKNNRYRNKNNSTKANTNFLQETKRKIDLMYQDYSITSRYPSKINHKQLKSTTNTRSRGSVKKLFDDSFSQTRTFTLDVSLFEF